MIKSFQGEYRWLSNFWPVFVEFDGWTYRSVEHAYQAAKSLDHTVRRRIQKAPTAAEAKRLGSKVRLRDDWERVNDSVMLLLLRRKYAHAELGWKLLETGTQKLSHGNAHGDVYWGTYQGIGLDKLALLTMRVRDELANEAQ
jgi:ribA/ribD-fused uncharacterized protein